MSQDEAFVRRAIALAIEHARSGKNGPFGALVVRAGSVISEGWNRVVSTHDPTAHAEIVAIREACAALAAFSLSGCTLYASCEPCPMCLAAIHWARIERVVFAAGAEDAAAAGFDDRRILRAIRGEPSARRVEAIRIATADRLEPFERWRSNPDRIPY